MELDIMCRKGKRDIVEDIFPFFLNSSHMREYKSIFNPLSE